MGSVWKIEVPDISHLLTLMDIAQPIKSISQLNDWENTKNQLNRCTIKLKKRSNQPLQKLLLCHDMQGGYLNDRFIQGTTTNLDIYHFKYWQYIVLLFKGWAFSLFNDFNNLLNKNG